MNRPIRSGWPTNGATQNSITKEAFLEKYCSSESVTKKREREDHMSNRIEIDSPSILDRLCDVPSDVMAKVFKLKQIFILRQVSKALCYFATEILEILEIPPAETKKYHFSYSDFFRSINPEIKEKFNFAIRTNIKWELTIKVDDLLKPQSMFIMQLHDVLKKKLSISVTISNSDDFYGYMLRYIYYLLKMSQSLENLSKDIGRLQDTFDQPLKQYKLCDFINVLSPDSMFFLNNASALKYIISLKNPRSPLITTGPPALQNFFQLLGPNSPLLLNKCTHLMSMILSNYPKRLICSLNADPNLLRNNSVLLHNNGEPFQIILTWQDPGFALMKLLDTGLLDLTPELFSKIVELVNSYHFKCPLTVLMWVAEHYELWKTQPEFLEAKLEVCYKLLSVCPDRLKQNRDLLNRIFFWGGSVKDVLRALSTYPRLLGIDSILFRQESELFKEILSSDNPGEKLCEWAVKNGYADL